MADDDVKPADDVDPELRQLMFDAADVLAMAQNEEWGVHVLAFSLEAAGGDKEQAVEIARTTLKKYPRPPKKLPKLK